LNPIGIPAAKGEVRTGLVTQEKAAS
jgi:hypothetical protein